MGTAKARRAFIVLVKFPQPSKERALVHGANPGFWKGKLQQLAIFNGGGSKS